MVKAKTAKKKTVKKKAVAKPKKAKSSSLSDPKLITGCRLWSKILGKANDGKYKIPNEIDRYGHRTIYNSGDYAQMRCSIFGKSAELTVGGSTGHKAKIDLNTNTLIYFDGREENNRTVWEILKVAGIKNCARDYKGVHCKGIKTQKQINGAFRAMVMPGSMDFRRSHCNDANPLNTCVKAEVKYFKNGPLKEK